MWTTHARTSSVRRQVRRKLNAVYRYIIGCRYDPQGDGIVFEEFLAEIAPNSAKEREATRAAVDRTVVRSARRWFRYGSDMVQCAVVRSARHSQLSHFEMRLWMYVNVMHPTLVRTAPEGKRPTQCEGTTPNSSL